MMKRNLVFLLCLNFVLPVLAEEIALPRPGEFRINSVLEEQITVPTPQVSQPVPNPLAPLWTNHSETPENDPNILIITDQASGAAAKKVKALFDTGMAPFNCMHLKVEIAVVTKEELGCNPYISGNTRLVYCTTNDAAGNPVRSDRDGGPGRLKAEELRMNHHAQVAIMVLDLPEWGGSGYRDIPMITTEIETPAAIHELLHSMGFADEYYEGELIYSSRKGRWASIMYTLDGYVPGHWWESIASYFGVPAPTPKNGMVAFENLTSLTPPPTCALPPALKPPTPQKPPAPKPKPPIKKPAPPIRKK
jgi:hypothetical protein